MEDKKPLNPLPIKVCPIEGCGFKTQEKTMYCPIHNVKLRILKKHVNNPPKRIRNYIVKNV